MNFFVEGLQGSGKSTLLQRLSELYPDNMAIREGDYSPIELAWCAYVDEDKYDEILEKYSDIREEIEKKSFVDISDKAKRVICYTQIITDVPGFHKNLEQYEIYNNRIPYDEFKDIVLKRYRGWHNNTADDHLKDDYLKEVQKKKLIFECSLFQNIIEDMILFRCASDEEIIGFYKEVREVLQDKDYHIFYLKADDVRRNLAVIRKERSDDQGNELWFPLMMGYFNECPYSKERGLSGEEDLIKHFIHRQELELRICREVFPDKCTVITSKNYSDDNLIIELN